MTGESVFEASNDCNGGKGQMISLVVIAATNANGSLDRFVTTK